MAPLPELGVGIVWWPPLDPLYNAAEGLVSVVEAEPEAYWVPKETTEGRGFCSALAEALGGVSQAKLLHGVGAPFGGTCRPPPGHQAAFAGDVARLRPAWISEHLSFSRFRVDAGEAVFGGFLLPPAQSRQGAVAAAKNIRCRRAGLDGIPVAFETGVSYLPPLPGEIADGEFAATVAEEADCGILLDLHNLYCNARNGRQPVTEFCASLPLDRVWELHLAGGQDLDGFRLDAHSGLVDAELFEMAADLVPNLPNLSAVIFEIMPDFVPVVGLSAVARQLERLHDLWARRRHAAGPAAGNRGHRTEPPANPHPEPSSWEALLGNAITGLAVPKPPAELAAWWQAAGPAVNLYRQLAQEARAGSLVATAPRTVAKLLQQRAPLGLRRLLGEFWTRSPPGYTAIEEGIAFLRFIAGLASAAEEVAEAVRDDEEACRQWLGCRTS